MKIEAAGDLLKEKIESSSISPPEKTPLYRAAGEIIEMALAYLSDGGTFLESGDEVNALASYAYGLGWLDAGIYAGLISCTTDIGFTTLECDEEIPETLGEHLKEKTGRYHRMLDSAVSGVAPASDKESPVFTAATDIMDIAGRHLTEGSGYEQGREGGTSLSSALWHFSYGYGWLDAGVRIGILSITGDRALFTV
ncbi:DUF357 domain-containing protein [Methanolacinia paynteri]|uniref:DUF357 domain-containing protein n=1 Tax=Methanolacinia paynteri TaxID=230356 RepID=UPI0006934356|nr:DUF357 domain-containing protein [Methanolacinia paynteri]